MTKKIDINMVAAFLPFYTQKRRYKFAFGGRGGAKSLSFSDIFLLIGRERKIRVLCTREIQKSIKDSVHTLLEDRINLYGFSEYEVKNNEIVNKLNGTEFIFTGLREHNVNSIKSYEGIDYCWVEEGQAIIQKSLSILTPTIRKSESEIWFSYNRISENDPVHMLFRKECGNNSRQLKLIKDKKEYQWQQFDSDSALGIYINYDGNPFFPKVLYNEMEKDKEWNYNLYLHKWKGEPENQSDNALISRIEVLTTIDKEVKAWNYIAFGIDPARYGDDESVVCIREGFKILSLWTFCGINTMQLTGKIIQFAKDYYQKGYKKPINIKIDDSGLGAGVTDRLSELQEAESIKPFDKKEFNIIVIPVINNDIPTDNKYKNYGTEIWGKMKDALKTISLPNDTELISQLTDRKYKIESDGTISIERKQDMKKRGLTSPDRADALGLCLIEMQNFDFSNDKIEKEKKK